ncbi:metal-dependent transcriptional regulator [Gulosibacter bifidus]|uniref:Metal-dependent transcriptional regulator n=1 Tax=Gulosibacter bifidus TaxID=272239 RepID=A0ABW5RH01_9MICO|nr:metal-dependent transcriptional regulator [Gulosibacter bifidus]
MTNLVDTTEMYLRTILDLEEEGITPLRARISERLGHSGPTVSQTIARMERDRLVEVAPDRTLVLTDEGRDTAVRVLRKHRIAEALLANVIGLDLSLVHDEACRWEHVMSDEAESRIYALLGEPAESPYGTPIPSLSDLYRNASDTFREGVVALDELLDARGAAATADSEPLLVTIRRLGEPVQSDAALLSELRQLELLPPATAAVRRDGDVVEFVNESHSDALRVPVEFAAHIYVTPRDA